MTTETTLYTKHKPQKATVKRIVNAIRTFEDRPFTAREIAVLFGHNTLYGSERTVIYQLVADGILEARLTQSKPTLVSQYVYKVIGKLPDVTNTA